MLIQHHINSNLFLTIFFLVLVIIIQNGLALSNNPCHSRKSSQGSGVNCQRVILPDGLCTKCKLRGFRPDGKFNNCRDIYNLDEPFCQAELINYAKLNPCDGLRNKYVQDFSNQYYKESLDYFVYSICEECCDCVPFGSKPWQYNWRSYNGLLLNAWRGNCPAHAFYDICKVLPNIKYIRNQWQPDFWWWPQICPLLTEWFKTPDANGWISKGQLKTLDWKISRFFNMFFGAAKCWDQEQWKQCTRLENAQHRLS